MFFKSQEKNNYLVEFFYFLSKLLVASLALELIIPGAVSYRVNLNLLLFLWFVLLVLVLIRRRLKK